MSRLSRGGGCCADFDPLRGHEQGRVREVLIISNNLSPAHAVPRHP